MSVRLGTTWMGIPLRNPLVAGASSLTRGVESVKRLEAAGVGAVVLHSLFEEQIELERESLEHYLGRAAGAHPEAQDYLPAFGNFVSGPEEYLTLVENASKAVAIPVVASLNGCSRGGWLEWARRAQEAGASALEMNTYQIATGAALDGSTVEASLVDLVADVASRLSIPVTVKLSPFYSSLPNLVTQLGKAGARGVTLFNRFLQPDIDPETLSVVPVSTLSDSRDLRLPLRWTALLAGRVPVEIAHSGGVHSGLDLVKALMAGAQVVQTASALVAKGPDTVGVFLEEAQDWMVGKEYESVDQIRGSMSQEKVLEPHQFERIHYMKALANLSDRFV